MRQNDEQMARGDAVAQSVERATPGEEVLVWSWFGLVVVQYNILFYHIVTYISYYGGLW